MLDAMKKPEGYAGPEVVTILKDPKVDPLPEFIDSILKSNISGKKIGIYMKNEEVDGDLTQTMLDRVKANNFEITEMAEFMNVVHKVKIDKEVQNVKVAAAFTEWTFKKIVGEIESVVDGDINIKQRKIAGNVERVIENNDKMESFMQKHGVTDSQLLEYPLPVLIQSGNQFTVNKFNSECDDQYLNPDVVYINVCGKFTDMQAMASRTLLFNPSDSQKEAYLVAFEAHQHLVQALKPGATISSAYRSTLNFINGKNKDLASKVHANFGFGIGIKYKEDLLSIKEANDTVIEAGMVFHARITFKDIEDKPEKSIIALGDTVLVT